MEVAVSPVCPVIWSHLSPWSGLCLPTSPIGHFCTCRTHRPWLLNSLQSTSSCDSNQGVYCQPSNSGSSSELGKTSLFVLCLWELGRVAVLCSCRNICWVHERHCSFLKSSSDHKREDLCHHGAVILLASVNWLSALPPRSCVSLNK